MLAQVRAWAHRTGSRRPLRSLDLPCANAHALDLRFERGPAGQAPCSRPQSHRSRKPRCDFSLRTMRTCSPQCRAWAHRTGSRRPLRSLDLPCANAHALDLRFERGPAGQAPCSRPQSHRSRKPRCDFSLRTMRTCSPQCRAWAHRTGSRRPLRSLDLACDTSVHVVLHAHTLALVPSWGPQDRLLAPAPGLTCATAR